MPLKFFCLQKPVDVSALTVCNVGKLLKIIDTTDKIKVDLQY